MMDRLVTHHCKGAIVSLPALCKYLR
eukprot:COSAG01_NODE_50835_length_360_cov_0.524904_1_plen_25_part_10